ncbi:hypothetical protein PCANC_03078 [Puccinia coronata f. sp. avenae]|uniref:Uncharacterized protein n=1 Tax=Puccinia coronata f. sp. avenae TaxID=200324 RepID=A0A2N5W4V1_9BASI|nr:hypothetical protein PCANC_03078 [Puccinia coronata f. sp. avenae]
MWAGLPETATQVHARLGDLTAVKCKTELGCKLERLQQTKPKWSVLHEAAHPEPCLLAAIRKARTTKTAQEVQLMRHANRVLSHAHTEVMKLVHLRALRSEADAEMCFRCACHGGGCKTQAYEPIFVGAALYGSWQGVLVNQLPYCGAGGNLDY